MDTRQRICEAAIRLAVRDGLRSLTLDGVAAETGLSKGGVTHHFGSKDDLLNGVMTYFSEYIESRLTTAVADDPKPRFRWIRAMLDTIYPGKNKKKDDFPTNGLMTAILAASIHNRELMPPIRQLAERLQKRLLDDNDGELDQLMLWLAMDGLFLWEFVGLIKPTDKLHKNVLVHMREQISDDDE